jgi:RimJ/RimL family protein N-acetyltransferase
MVVNDPRCVTRRVLRSIFTALFSRAVRVTFMTRPENQKAITGIRRLGAQYEGYCRLGLEGKWDALVFGMLRDECAYLPGYVHRPRLDAGMFASETLQ